jgi:hypothetical protein
MMRTDYLYYEVHRSRNNGEFWSNLTHGQELSWDEANCFMEKEIEKHPSDWLKLIKVQATTIRDYSGNKKKKSVKKSDSKEPLIHGYTVPEYIKLIEKAHEATKNSTLVFK